MSALTSSVVIAQALRIAPDGAPARKPGVCALCGLDIAIGDLCARLSLDRGFMDDVSMVARGSQVTCGYCPPLMRAKPLRDTGFGSFSAVGGFQPFCWWVEGTVAKQITQPPEPPFVMVYATARNQHMAWRAPVNLSRDLFYVRVGLRDLKIRRHILAEAVDHCRVLGEALYPAKDGAPPSTRKPLTHPFVKLDANLKDGDHGRLNHLVFSPDIAAAVKDYAVHLAAIMSLTAGEIWALKFILTPNAGKAPAPG